MADVCGPTYHLPGDQINPPADTMCDQHPERRATYRVFGEVDSMGAELHDCCDECMVKMRDERLAARQTLQPCDWGKHEGLDVRPQRDPEEGMAGPVYYACGDCRKKLFERLREEEDYDAMAREGFRGTREEWLKAQAEYQAWLDEAPADNSWMDEIDNEQPDYPDDEPPAPLPPVTPAPQG